MWTQPRCEECHRNGRGGACSCGRETGGPGAANYAPTALLPVFPGDFGAGDGRPPDSSGLRIFEPAGPDGAGYYPGERRAPAAESRPGVPAPQVAAVAGAAMLAATVAVCVLAVVTAHRTPDVPAPGSRPVAGAAPVTSPSARPAPPSPGVASPSPTPTASASASVSASASATESVQASDSPAASPPSSVAAPASVRVRAAASGRCLTVRNAVDVEMRDCDGSRSQQWSLTAAGELRDANDACLAPRATTGRPSAVVHLLPCGGNADQTWAAGPGGAVVGVGSGLCLDVFQGRPDNGTPVLVQPCTRQPNQRWSVR
ncbi:ricin-type beta-trefoil lectin domain protein [Kitasatospora sp. NPDC088346]|uniref:ricin-type beta-trefoil lectin domain protein n=1 Tax=Kitasatospora sp. NPDC088346 TaxID=3364073 RepID=UPI0037F693A0